MGEGHRAGLAQIQKYVQRLQTIRVLLKFTEVSDDLIERDFADASGANEFFVRIKAVGDGQGARELDSKKRSETQRGRRFTNSAASNMSWSGRFREKAVRAWWRPAVVDVNRSADNCKE